MQNTKANNKWWDKALLIEDFNERMTWVKDTAIENFNVDIEDDEDSISSAIKSQYESTSIAYSIVELDSINTDISEVMQLQSIYQDAKDRLLIWEKIELPAKDIEDKKARETFLIERKYDETLLSQLQGFSENDYYKEVDKLNNKFTNWESNKMQEHNGKTKSSKRDNELDATTKILLLKELGFFELPKIQSWEGSMERKNIMMGKLLGCSSDRAGKLTRNISKAKSSTLWPDYLKNMDEIDDLLG